MVEEILLEAILLENFVACWGKLKWQRPCSQVYIYHLNEEAYKMTVQIIVHWGNRNQYVQNNNETEIGFAFQTKGEKHWP